MEANGLLRVYVTKYNTHPENNYFLFLNMPTLIGFTQMAVSLFHKSAILEKTQTFMHPIYNEYFTFNSSNNLSFN